MEITDLVGSYLAEQGGSSQSYQGECMKIIELNKSPTASNDQDAELLRAELKKKDIFLVNLMSAAGSGKTAVLTERIVRRITAVCNHHGSERAGANRCSGGGHCFRCGCRSH